MLVLMTWYSDGSGNPSLYFFEKAEIHNVNSPIFRLIPKLVEEIELHKKAVVYKIGALDAQPTLLHPKGEAT